jgi:hypothetical protein
LFGSSFDCSAKLFEGMEAVGIGAPYAKETPRQEFFATYDWNVLVAVPPVTSFAVSIALV